MSELLLVADIGTSAVKAALMQPDGGRLAEVVHSYEHHAQQRPGRQGTSQAGAAAGEGEIDPELWWLAFRGAVRELLHRARTHAHSGNEPVPARIVMTGQMQNLILLRDSDPVRSAILYYDSRGEGELEPLFSALPRERHVEITANTPDGAGFPAKLLWLKRNEPDALGHASTLLCGAHDFVAHRLTGSLKTDVTTASTTGLFATRQGRWSEEIAEACALDPGILPEACTADSSDGTLSADAAATLGLPRRVEVLHGMGDVGASVLGSGDLSARLACYLGTSGWMLDTAHVDAPGDPEKGMFNLRHPTAARLIRVAPLLTAAGAAEWAARVLSHGEEDGGEEDGGAGARDPEAMSDGSSAMSHLTERAAGEPAGSRGVLFLPHLAGERTPFKDAKASALFLGLRRQTSAATMFRAVLEGVAFSLRAVGGALRPREPSAPLLLSGGGAQSSLWPQIIADVTNRRVDVVRDAQLIGLYGSLALGRFAARRKAASGASEASVAGSGEVQVSRSFYPQTRNRRLYDEQFRVYQELYPQLRASMHRLRDIHHGKED